MDMSLVVDHTGVMLDSRAGMPRTGDHACLDAWKVDMHVKIRYTGGKQVLLFDLPPHV